MLLEYCAALVSNLKQLEQTIHLSKHILEMKIEYNEEENVVYLVDPQLGPLLKVEHTDEIVYQDDIFDENNDLKINKHSGIIISAMLGEELVAPFIYNDETAVIKFVYLFYTSLVLEEVIKKIRLEFTKTND